MEKLKRVVIKEEFVVLTGNFKAAILLNQMIYWSERVKDFDEFIKEESERIIKDGKTPEFKPSNGWIYKTSEELSNETMIGLSPSNIRKYLKDLVEKGWLNERNNPIHKWDRTIQYRVNIAKIQKDLLKIGYSLEGYPFFKIENGDSEIENHNSKTENQTTQNRKAIPEITTEITNKDNIGELVAIDKIPYKGIIEYLNEKAGTKYKYTTKATKDKIKARWNEDYTLEDFKAVIDKKCAEWLNTDMQKFLRPETLFGNKFEGYLNQCVKIKPKDIKVANGSNEFDFGGL